MDFNEIADRLEAIIQHVITEFKKQNTEFIDYSMLFNPQVSDTWYIVIFFENAIELKKRIRSGNCYTIHSWMLELIKQNDLENLPCQIVFESGKSPSVREDYEALHKRLHQKSESMKKSEGKSVDICSSCGHGFNKHELLGWPGEDGKTPPRQGWIVCPEENCVCFQTWGTNYRGPES